MATPLETAIEALERASITFSIISSDRSNIARTCDDAKRSAEMIESTLASLRVIEPSAPALPDALTEFFAAVEHYNSKINDPKGNGTGDEARSPTGDDYNALMGLIETFSLKVGG